MLWPDILSNSIRALDFSVFFLSDRNLPYKLKFQKFIYAENILFIEQYIDSYL